MTHIDQLTISGFEIDASYAMTENLTVYGGAGFLNSEIEENANRPLSVGNDVPQAPGSSGNFGVEWVSSVGSGMDLVARIDYQYIGAMHFHTLQGEQTPTIWNALPQVSTRTFRNRNVIAIPLLMRGLASRRRSGR